MRAAELRTFGLLAQGVPIARVLDEILTAFEQAWPGALCSILLVDPRRQTLGLGAAPSLPEAYCRAIDGMSPGPRAGSCGTAAWRKEPVVVEDLACDPLWEDFREAALAQGLRSCWSVPVLAGDGQVRATFAVYHRHRRRPERRELGVLAEWAHLVDLAIELDRRHSAVRESEELLRMASQVSRLGALRIDLADGRFTWSDEARILCEAPEGFVPNLQEVLKFVAPERREAVESDLEACARDGRPFDREFQLVTGRGRNLWVRAVGQGVRDEAGRLIAVQGALQDISARRASEERLLQQSALLDAAQDAILVRDHQDRIVYWNLGCQRLYGWSSEEALGRSNEELLYRDPSGFRAGMRILLAQGQWKGELEQVTRSGEARTVEVRWTLVRDEAGRPKSILCINTDITERRRIEHQFFRTQRMESLGTLAGGIAHDLNNVLSPILMAQRMLREGEEDPRRRELLDTIGVSAERGREMVAQVLTFARGTEGQRAAVQLGDVVRELAKFVGETFPKDIGVETEIAPDLWPLLADRIQLHQVLLNLCVNARDAMPEGGVLALRAHNVTLGEAESTRDLEARPGRYVRLEVQDTGSGIPREVLDRIFEPFFTTKPPGKGTGLGLSTTLGIVRGHGGFVQVHSETGKGTRFLVHLPARPEAPRETPEEGDATRPRGRGETILVVDDEASLLRLTCRMLETFGYRTLPAANGAEAVALFRRHRGEIAAVLTDMSMPVMDGPATVQALLEIDPDARILCTSGWAPETLGPGLRGFVPKPCTVETLLQTVRRVLVED